MPGPHLLCLNDDCCSVYSSIVHTDTATDGAVEYELHLGTKLSQFYTFQFRWPIGSIISVSVFCVLVVYPLLQAVLLGAGVVMASLLSNCVFPVYLRSFSAINLQ